jgi:hypothetical protein
MLGNTNLKILGVENEGVHTVLTMSAQYLTKLFTIPFPNTKSSKKPRGVKGASEADCSS